MVYITGDIHGSAEPLYDLFERFQPAEDDIIVLLGDVGVNYTGKMRDRLLKQELCNMKSTFFCIHGNHENRPQNIASYQEKQWHGGRVLYEEDFPNILFPVDRLRMGYNWWPDEQPTPTIKKYVEQQCRTKHIDVVFSHTCPYKYVPTECFLPGIDQSTVDNSTEHWLDTIEEMLEYKAWYLGHWHINKRIDRLHFLMHDVEMLIE